jgi:hypothetical protein
MKALFFILAAGLFLQACNGKSEAPTPGAADSTMGKETRDTLTYAYKPSYSSDISVPSNPGNAQKVLQVWWFFEHNLVDSMKPYFADSITYEDASGMRYRGTTDGLLSIVRGEMKRLDSLRFDIQSWESAHVNDKNEDWVRIWSRERFYPKQGKADSVLMQENWLVKDGRVIYFNQFTAKLPK